MPPPRSWLPTTPIMQQIPLQRLFDSFSSKFPVEKLDPYHYFRSLAYFEDAEKDPLPRMLSSCPWDAVKETLQQAVRGLSLG